MEDRRKAERNVWVILEQDAKSAEIVDVFNDRADALGWFADHNVPTEIGTHSIDGVEVVVTSRPTDGLHMEVTETIEWTLTRHTVRTH